MATSLFYCPNCGAVNRTDDVACFSCGAALAGPPPQPVGKPAVQAPPQPAGMPAVQAPPQSAKMPAVQTPPLPGEAPGIQAPPVLPVDHLLKGRYRVLAQIGQGGFGAVYKAEDVELGDRLVAVKEMRPGELTPEEVAEAAEAFHREALLLGSLQHLSLPRIYDQFSEGEHSYLAMEFIEGETLEQYLGHAPGGRLSVREALQVAIQLCAVLEYLHSQQPPIIFRDLKPANVMREPDGRLVLIDFGIARHFKPGKTRDTVALGSPGYAAPEQYGKAQTTPRSDVFSLGALLHQLLTKTDPSEQPFRFAPVTVPAPAGLPELIARMVDLDPKERPASMTEVKADLERLADEWKIEQEEAKAAKSAPHPAPVHHPSPAQPVVQPTAAPASPPVRPRPAWAPARPGQAPAAAPKPSGRSGNPVLQVIWVIVLIVCSVIAGFVLPGRHSRSTQTHQYTGPNYLATYDAEQRATALVSPPKYPITDSLAWSPDGTSIAAANEDGVRIWVALTRSVRLGYSDQSSLVQEVAWSPDGGRIASLGFGSTVQVWDPLTGFTIVSYRGQTDIDTFAWSPDGKQIVAALYGATFHIWDAATGQDRFTVPRRGVQITSLAWSPNGKLIASGELSGDVEVWDASSGATIYTYRHHSAAITHVVWSPDSKRLASASADKTVQVWDATTGANPLVYRGHTDQVNALAWSPDGQAIASAGGDTTVQVWKASDGSPLYTYRGHAKSVRAVAWSPTCKMVAPGQPCRIASGGVDGIHIWDALTGGDVLIFPVGGS